MNDKHMVTVGSCTCTTCQHRHVSTTPSVAQLDLSEYLSEAARHATYSCWRGWGFFAALKVSAVGCCVGWGLLTACTTSCRQHLLDTEVCVPHMACVPVCVDSAGGVCGMPGLTCAAEDCSRGGAAADQDHHQHTQEAAQHGGPGCAQQSAEGQGPASCSQVGTELPTKLQQEEHSGHPAP